METSFSDIVRFLEHVVWGVIGAVCAALIVILGDIQRIGKVKSILAPESGSVR